MCLGHGVDRVEMMEYEVETVGMELGVLDMFFLYICKHLLTSARKRFVASYIAHQNNTEILQIALVQLAER